jgi:hypothetical protein
VERDFGALLPCASVINHRERFADTGEHSECQYINFEDAEFFYVIFVPLDDSSSFHGRMSNRNNSIERLFGDNKSSHML